MSGQDKNNGGGGGTISSGGMFIFVFLYQRLLSTKFQGKKNVHEIKLNTQCLPT